MTFSRREFLGAVGIATAWTITAKAEPERSANNIVRIGVIGTGVRGKYLIGNLPPSVTVGAICDCASLRIASVMEPKGEFAKVLRGGFKTQKLLNRFGKEVARWSGRKET